MGSHIENCDSSGLCPLVTRSGDWRKAWACSLCLLAQQLVERPRRRLGLGGGLGPQVRQPELRGLLLGRTVDRYAKSEVEDCPLCPLPQVGVSSLGPVCHPLGELDLRKEAAHVPPPSLPFLVLKAASGLSLSRPLTAQPPAWPPPLPPSAPQPHWLPWRSSLPGLSSSSSSLKRCPFESPPLCPPPPPLLWQAGVGDKTCPPAFLGGAVSGRVRGMD